MSRDSQKGIVQRSILTRSPNDRLPEKIMSRFVLGKPLKIVHIYNDVYFVRDLVGSRADSKSGRYESPPSVREAERRIEKQIDRYKCYRLANYYATGTAPRAAPR